MSGLNLGLIKSLSMRLPPIGRQREFARLTRRVRLLERQLGQAEEESHTLFAALVQSAFRGQITCTNSKAQLGLFEEAPSHA
jgi:type I restriction enzyme S subunit